ncbi:hypothetical protein SAY87_016483 [Trapa incisa]|uniref:Uncharacterized protein n=1 Tax=Trapa incisa TaxID=236973 RepID=A0AAN7QVF0_9MYRT|nr:hypothetical protein SAY87_016483 [Trapa incisa]
MIFFSTSQWFTKRQKKALYEALHKIKDELMILGFISLLLVFGQKYITEICILEEIAGKMLPCISDGKKSKDPGDPKPPGRHLLSSERRYLAAGSSGPSCKTVCE